VNRGLHHQTRFENV